MFQGEEGFAEVLGEMVSGGQRGSEFRKVIAVPSLRLRQDEAAGFEVGVKGVQEFGEAAVSDLLKNGGLGEVFKIVMGHTGSSGA